MPTGRLLTADGVCAYGGHVITILVIFVGGFLLFGVLTVIAGAPGISLQRRFVGTNPLAGKTEQEIVLRCGAPSSRSVMPGGYLLQWQATGYHIALSFDKLASASGVTHEFAA